MSIPFPIRSAKDPFPPGRGLPACLLALFGALLFSLPFVSCHSSDAGDVYVLSFKLDSSKVGKFDSMKVEVYNGKPPGPGDTASPAQVKVFDIGKGETEVKLELSGKVTKNFSVIVTGFDSTGMIYRKLQTYANFSVSDKQPAVLLISRIAADSLTLSVGEMRAPSLTLTPADAGDKRVLFTSGAPAIVQVVGDSLKGLLAGKAMVTVMTVDAEVKDSFLVTVTAVRVTGVKSKDLSLKVGDTASPEVTFLPANATDKGYALQSSDSSVVAVAGQSLHALKVGNVQVIIASSDGGAKDTLAVDVRIPVKGIAAGDLSKEVGDKFVPDLTFDPSDATDRKYALASNDSTKVRVESDSLLAMAAGKDTVTITSNDGAFTARFAVIVAPRFFKVNAVKAKDLRGVPSDTLSPDLTWDPLFATNQDFTLKSLDTSRVLILGKRFFALALGTAQVEVTTADGGLKDTFDVSIESPNFQSDILPITSFKCAPCHAPGTTFNWQDSTLLIRKSVTAIDRLTRPDTAVGRMPLAGAPNGPLNPRDLSVMLNWLTRVAVPLKSIAAADTAVNLGDTVTPALIFTPPNASDRLYSLSSSDTAIVAIRGAALLPMDIGQATVFASSDEGGLKAQMKVTVNPPAFGKNVLPIVKIKCFPCHTPGTTFNWQDSTALLSDGSTALRRLNLPYDSVGHMPLKGSDRGELTPAELKIILGWLGSKVVPLKGITVPDDSILLGSSKPPAIVWNPAGATNKSFVLLSNDTSKVGVLGTNMVGKALGSATVEVRTVEGDFSKLVTVKVIPIKVDSLTIRDTAGAIGDTVYPKPGFIPANATNQSFTIALLKPSSIVKVDSGIRIIGLSLGKDTLEATSADQGKKTRFAFTVGPVPPKSLAVPDTNGTLGSLITPRLIWTPSTVTNKAYTLAIAAADTVTAAVRGAQILCKTVGIAVVTATSTADSTVTAGFKFTVGPVGVIGLTIAPVTTNIGITLTPAITWNPVNATNKAYSLSILSTLDTARFQVTGSGTTLLTRHLGTGSITVTSLDSNKTAAWSVNVIRTSFTSNLLGITTFKCGACHKPPVPPATSSSPPNWQDSATVVAFGDSIKARIALPFADPSHMPQGKPVLSGDTLAIITNWLNQN